MVNMIDNPFSQMEIVDLGELADIISERVSNPITIEDFNHRLVAYSTHADSTDKARMETIMARRVPEKVLNRLWQDGILQKLMESDEPVRIKEIREVGLGDRVAISIRKGHGVLGYIYVQELNKRLGEEELQFLRLAAKAAMPRLHQRQTKRRIQEEKSKEFFWELLLGNLTSHHEIQARAETMDIKLPKPFSIFLFETDHPNYETVQKELNYLFANLHDSFPLTRFPVWVTNQKHLIVMGGRCQNSEEFISYANLFIEDVQKRIQKRFGQTPFIGVFGSAYKSFQSIEQSYHQAMSVLRMKKVFPRETASIHGYPDLGMYRLLPFFAERNMQVGYSNYRLQKIINYDQENQSHLLQTLEEYLDCAGRVNVTAQKLHIHPNTLAYRLKRIEEVGGINLEDVNHRVSLFIDIKLVKLSQ